MRLNHFSIFHFFDFKQKKYKITEIKKFDLIKEVALYFQFKQSIFHSKTIYAKGITKKEEREQNGVKRKKNHFFSMII